MRLNRAIAALLAGLLGPGFLTFASHLTVSVSHAKPQAAPASPKPGEVWLNPKDGLKYVWIPPGTFTMGCSPGDTECDNSEKPSHQVSITKGFWIGQTPVTVGAYKRFASATGKEMPSAPSFNANWTNDKMPIVNVSWNDAQAYCQWSGGRLPTEAEWEYAARGGSTEARYGPLDDVAWYADNSGRQRLNSAEIEKSDSANFFKRLNDNGNGTHEVAQKRANGFGLYDTLGNAWQWVNDWYKENYYQSSPSSDPRGPSSGEGRVLRGGSWVAGPGAVRVSFRLYFFDPARRVDGFGFRCVGETTTRATLSEPEQPAAPAQSASRVETPQTAAQTPSAGTVRQNSKDGMKYVWIPAASFTMGCSPGVSECGSDEKPPHQVSITKGFWIGRTPVTVGAYKRFASATGQQMPPAPDFNSKWTNENMPVVNVTWNDSQAYCQWAGGRLPTEAEWEYAARGGSTEARYGPLDDVAWYADNSGRQRLDVAEILRTDSSNYFKRITENGNGTHDVAQKRANAFGLYDTLGNVWQWVNDWYDANYYQSSPSSDPPGPSSGQSRVLRGGSWASLPWYVRVSYRGYSDPANRNYISGFRCVGEANLP